MQAMWPMLINHVPALVKRSSSSDLVQTSEACEGDQRKAHRILRPRLQRRSASSPYLALGRQSDSQTSSSVNPFACSSDAVSYSHFTILVVGASTVGKSTFISRASAPGCGIIPSSDETGRATLAVDGGLCKVSFRETLLTDLARSADEPDYIHPTGPDHDAIILLYSRQNEASLKGVPELLRKPFLIEFQSDRSEEPSIFARAAKPVVIVATHCDDASLAGLVDSHDIASRAKAIVHDLVTYEVATESSEMPRTITQALLATVIARSSLPVQEVRRQSGSLLSLARKHAAAAKFPVNRATPLASTDLVVDPATVQLRARQRLKVGNESCSSLPLAKGFYLDEASPQESLINGPGPCAQQSTSTPSQALLDLEDTLPDGDIAAAGIVQYTAKPIPSIGMRDFPPGGSIFDELVDRLLQPIPSTEEEAFQHSFLALYRMFSPPSQLLAAITSSYESVTRDDVTPWDCDSKLDRHLSVLNSWLFQHPGDFAKSQIQLQLRQFLLTIDAGHDPKLTSNQAHAHNECQSGLNWSNNTSAVYRLSLALHNVAPDEDTDWACSDPGPSTIQQDTLLSISNVISLHDLPRSIRPEVARMAMSKREHDTRVIFRGHSPMALTTTVRTRGKSDVATLSPMSLHSIVESAHRQACLLEINPSYPLDKVFWTTFMSHSEQRIACEITRIDWILFSTIQPRDVVREVTTPHATKCQAQTASARRIKRLIEHFNHLAYWVTNLVLSRQRVRNRAQTLEKLMCVARELRRLNNYNALAAFVAAIRGPAISRLTATRQLVDLDVQKKFASLEVLLSTSRSHWAYRFALENSEQETLPRIPFFPLHRRDLIVAEDGGRTFVDDAAYIRSTPSHRDSAVAMGLATPESPGKSAAKINWHKFAIMGHTLNILRRAQAIPYEGLMVNVEVRNLLLKARICMDEDELYERSVGLEAGAQSAEGDDQDLQPQNFKSRINSGLDRLSRLTSLPQAQTI